MASDMTVAAKAIVTSFLFADPDPRWRGRGPTALTEGVCMHH